MKNISQAVADYRAKIRTAAESAAKAEAALLVSQQALAAASQDDGKIDPSMLAERIEAASRATSISQICANRAAATLSDLEAEFEIFVLKNAETVVQELRRLEAETLASTLKTLNGMLAFPNDHGSISAAEAFAGECRGVGDRFIIRRQIETAINALRIGTGDLAGVADALESTSLKKAL